MKGFILGKKGHMEQRFTESGVRIPVTHIVADSCYLVNINSLERNHYFSAQLGFGIEKKSIRKSRAGQTKKAGITTPLHFLKEIRLDNSVELVEENGKKGLKSGDISVLMGQQIKPALFFKKDDLVNITGISKGKGFQGVVKRHKFSGGPRTHGQSDRERAPGSIGQTTTPGRVYKGKRMAGRMGGDKITVQSFLVVDVGEDYFVVKGVVPGAKKGLLTIIKN